MAALLMGFVVFLLIVGVEECCPNTQRSFTDDDD